MSEIERKKKLGRLHQLKAERGLDDDTYRDMLERKTGKRSAAQLTIDQLDLVIGGFHVKQNTNIRYTKKITALWLAAHNLGIVASRHTAALDEFVKRQTGKEVLTFLTPAEANAVTEALKAMLTRAGFEIPARDEGGLNARRALLKLQWQKLSELGAVKINSEFALNAFLTPRFLQFHGGVEHLSPSQADACANELGTWLRRVQKKVVAP